MTSYENKRVEPETMTEAELLTAIGGNQRESAVSGLEQSGFGSIAKTQPAVEELLRRHYEWLSRLCFFEYRNGAAALDGLQEVLIEVAKSLQNFDGRSSIRTWMFVVARRTMMRFRKRDRKREQRFPLGKETDVADYGGAPLDESIRAKSTEEVLIASEEQRNLLRLIRELPEKQRYSIFFHYFEDLSVEETAARLQCSAGSVKTHLFRGRQRLKELLEAGGR